MTMLQTVPFNPWRDMNRFLLSRMPEGGWVPDFDIEEADTAYVLRGDIPGVDQKDLEVRFDDGVLIIRGERKVAETDNRFRRTERLHGQFERRFRVSDQVNADGVKASYANGVLEITLPKQEPVETSRLIPVQ